MPAWGLAVAIAVLGGCVPPGGNYPSIAEQDLAPYIGRDYWAKRPFQLYLDLPSCSIDPGTCESGAAATGRFRIDGMKGTNFYHEVLAHFVFEHGAHGYAFVTKADFGITFLDHPPPPPKPKPQTYPAYIDRLPAKEAERLKQLPGVELGMTQTQVLATVWGKPDKVKEIKRAHSDRVGWYYDDGSALFFDDGYLYAIEK